ncbi:WD repeat-containing protein 19 [Aphanomyces cochlioides]|nr:WD repeat-containing protein 19 [Aphanomyces cochlioides]
MLLAIGTSRGQVVFYEAAARPTLRMAMSKHKKKILCGDWNSQNEFAFGSEDRQITICWKDGSVVDQVKIKAAPVCIQFGGRHSNQVKRIVSVNMGRETILLYDLNEKDNALELAFQARYGDIVNYRWFGRGYIIAGFSLGYVVIISTHMNEIGQEQYCAKFHENHLHAICYNEVNGMVATCGDAAIKVVRMADWKEIAVEDLNREATAFDDLNWTQDGRILSVSCHNGWLHHFKLLHMEQAFTELDSTFAPTSNLVNAILAPFTPAVLAFTIVSMVGCLTFLASFSLNVSVWQLFQAMSGLCIRL